MNFIYFPSNVGSYKKLWENDEETTTVALAIFRSN